MKSKPSLLRRIFSVFLSFAIVLPLSLFLIGDSGSAMAMESLPYIEELKTNNVAFKILEIVPDASQGSIGYLINGAEPCSDWVTTAGAQATTSARQSYISALFSNLKTAGILGSGNTTPLEGSGSYSEVYPWSTHTGYSKMSLDHWETANNVGSTFTAADNGEYSACYTYTPDSLGTYMQVITGLISDTATTSGSYYYNMSFAKIDSSTTLTAGSLIYSVTAGTPDISPTIDGATVNLACVGVYGYSNFPGIDSDVVSYIASPAGVPQTTYDALHPYRAIGLEYRSASSGEQGLFSRQLSAYEYVGEGGQYSFASSATETHTILYNTVYFSGGYSNNNWFLRYAFDWDPAKEAEPKISFKVSAVAGNKVDAASLATYDLIILDGGVSPGGTAASYSSASDISTAVRAEMLTLSASTSTRKGTPIIVDSSLVSGSLNVNTLAKALDNSWSNPHVTGNIFCTTYPLANSCFTSYYNSSIYSASGTQFYAVYDEINDQNLLRSISGVDALPTSVNPARAVRCIINSVGKKAQTDKSVISVLEIEPGRGKELNSNTVLQWLGYESNSTSISVNITTMSSSEYIGKIDDISEKYDLVYIGSDLTGFNTYTYCGEAAPNYSDDNMDGLVYSNIGDQVVSGGESGWSMSGLLDRDYSTTTFTGSDSKTYYALHTGTTSSPYNDSRTFRFSGNDLTSSKMEQLEAFAASGYPIVVEDDLMQGIKTSVPSDPIPPGICSYNSRRYYCLYTPNLTFNSSSLSLTAALSTVNSYNLNNNNVYNSGYVYNGTCSLYKVGVSGAADTLVSSKAINYTTPAVFDLSSTGYTDSSQYYCTVTVAKVISGSTTYTPSSEVNKGKSMNFTLYKDLNAYRVDSSSYMYQTLQNTVSKTNVMTEKYALANNDTLRQYVNLAKPAIVFSVNSDGTTAYPTVYTKNSDGSVTSLSEKNGGYYLEYRFTISNSSDPTPNQTSYSCKLFIDENGDGLYSASSKAGEQLKDIIIRKWNSTTGTSGDIVANGSLKADVEYYVSRKLPEDKLGLIPWKLEIVSANSSGVSGAHTSYHNYTHVPVPTDASGAPDSTKIPTINILQVNTSRSGASGIDLGAQLRVTSSGSYYSTVTKKYYAGIYGKLIADISDDFNISITTTKASALDSSANWVHGSTTYTNVTDYLNSYDMIILGFDDCYQELSLNSAKAVVNYISSGKATLFTHDCTSFFFLPFANYPTENKGIYNKSPYYVYSTNDTNPSYSMFGYNFNMTIRDAVGLDRYGVTNKTYGLSKKSNPGLSYSGIVASTSYSSLKGTDAQIAALLNAGYSIAYKPSTARTSTVAETQGLTRGILMRNYKSGGTPTSDSYSTGLETTSTVSQVNEGQITTYPYNINTAAFTSGGSANTMGVATTHAQYQQLNMNSNDIVVWYCLSGGTFDYLPNDVINSYYLYSRGNVTYSGCGHTTSTINENEAKLFVNTMVAAYRIALSAPTVSFSDASGQKSLENYLIPADSSGVLELGSSNTLRNICFTINDTNLADKILSASFTYGAAKTDLDVPIYDSVTGTAIASGVSLTSGIVYCIKLDDVWAKLSSADKATVSSGIPINITVTSSLNTNPGTNTVTLRSFTLSSLK